jgi:hypothetical protein
VTSVIDHAVYHSDAAWDRWGTYAEVDATPETLAAYAAWQDAEAERKTLQQFKTNLAEARERVGAVVNGSYVELSRKRCKIPFGTRGHVFWTGANHYGARVGFKDSDGETYWTAERNVSVVEGHEDWSESCQDCGGNGWLPAHDGKGGHTHCPACKRRAAEFTAQREREQAEQRAAYEAELAGGGFIGRGTRVEVVTSNGNDAPTGSTGEVFWRGAGRFGDGERVGFKNDSGKTLWAAVANVRHEGHEGHGAVATGTSSYSVPSPVDFAA